jgi:predicted nucleic acid-binding protein
MKSYVLDACAIIALYAKEKNHEIIAQIYEEAASGKISLIMHRVNLLEVYYYVFKRESRANADKIFQNIQQSKIKLMDDLDDSFLKSAGYYKSTYKISFADSFVLAAGQRCNATIITADHEFDKAEQVENLQFLWFK